jgi:hypothetical protein
MVTVFSAQAMFPRYLVSQSILRMTSIPWEFNIIRLVGNITPLRLIGMLITPKWHGMWPSKDLVIRCLFKATVGISWVSTKCEEMKEWECDRTTSEMRGLSRKIILGILDETRMRKHTQISIQDQI